MITYANIVSKVQLDDDTLFGFNDSPSTSSTRRKILETYGKSMSFDTEPCKYVINETYTCSLFSALEVSLDALILTF